MPPKFTKKITPGRAKAFHVIYVYAICEYWQLRQNITSANERKNVSSITKALQNNIHVAQLYKMYERHEDNLLQCKSCLHKINKNKKRRHEIIPKKTRTNKPLSPSDSDDTCMYSTLVSSFKT